MTPDIHPDMRKFWEDKGFPVYDCVLSPLGEKAWVIEKFHPSGTQTFPMVAYIPHGTDIIHYWIDGREYEEKVALRVIKLTAFL